MSAMNRTISKKIHNSGVIAVIVIDQLDHAEPLAQALLRGGVDIIELTLRTPAALAAARIIKDRVPEITLGFGTVLTKDQVHQVIDVGADFAVAPGYNPSIVEEAKVHSLPFAPGVMTPSEIELAVEHGCTTLKYFPAETSGGLKNLNSMAAPYLHLGLQFIPLGGVNQENAEQYLNSNLIAAIGGSWIAQRTLIQNEDWATITTNALNITTLIKKIRLSASVKLS